MTPFLLDSCFCIDCLRRKPAALQALQSVAPASVAVSAITVGELMLGTRLSAHPVQERARVEAFLHPIQVIPFGRSEALEWASLEARLRKAGSRIEAEDAMIAATARVHGMALVSSNSKHFGRVRGLKVVDWGARMAEGTTAS